LEIDVLDQSANVENHVTFTLQVEELRQPGLAGVPVAVRQHADVISVNYPARQAGVRKHMTPAKVGPY
jgi:nucleotidyltransferase/DNA polymerase involved in DNA repair